MFENLALYQDKLALCYGLSEAQTHPAFSLSCIYHGILIQFHTNSEPFFNELKVLLPKTWLRDDSLGVDVYFTDIGEVGYFEDRWSDETSQDCDYLFDQGIAIQRDFVAKINSHSKVSVICEEKVSDGFYNFMRWFLPIKLLALNKYVLHSSCLLGKQSMAHFFLGHSGAGKTTLTSLDSSKKVLGDDMNILSVEDGHVFASGGAIGGAIRPDVDYNQKFEVGSFNWLIQAPEHSRLELGKEGARVKLIASITNLFWENLEHNQLTQIMKDVDQIVQNYNFYDLKFSKDPSFWNLINE